MMDSRTTLKRAIDDCFEHLGVDALYIKNDAKPLSIVVLKLAADSDYRFGDSVMVGEKARFEVRMEDIGRPLPEDRIVIEHTSYELIGEPLRNIERGTWDVEGMVVAS